MTSRQFCNICQGIGLPDIVRSFANNEPTSIEFSSAPWSRYHEKDQQSLPHHLTYSSLIKAVEQGCLTCTAFQRALLDQYKLSYSWPEEKTVRFQRCIDQHFDAPFSVFPSLAEFAHFSYLRPHMFPAQEEVADEAKTALAEYLTTEPMLEPRAYMASDTKAHINMMRQPSDMPDPDLYNSWIRSCAAEHKKCGPIVAKPLPTRLIDIGKSSHENPKLVGTAGQVGIYVALSHCWGGWCGLVTNDSNYQSHLQGIPLSSMPKTFRDAVEIVRVLGFQYLWIDSLCIIQGNTADWESEGGHMCSVYENSCLTIAGPDASNPEGGLLHPRSPSPYHSVDLLESANGARISLISLLPDCAHPPRADRPLLNTVLGERGWCLQERLLSPRVLYFFRFYLYFECWEHDFSELSWKWLHPYEHYNMIPKTQLYARDYDSGEEDSGGEHSGEEDSGEEDSGGEHSGEEGSGETVAGENDARQDSLTKRARAMQEGWWRLVENYSCRHLSYQSDKLPAIQGLAQYFFDRHEDVYLAGIWRSDLLHHLSWFRCIRKDTPSNIVNEYRAPSWSWAAVDGEVNFHSYSFRCEKFEGEHPYLYATVVAAETQLASYAPFGKVVAGSLTLRTPVQRFHIRAQRTLRRMNAGESMVVGVWVCNEQSKEQILVANLLPDREDFFSLVTDAGLDMECALLWQNMGNAWCALAVELAGDDHNLYRRVGFLNSLNMWEGEYPAVNWADAGEREILIV
jgi:hypothetical protein